MRHRKTRGFRHSSNSRGFRPHRNGDEQNRRGPTSFSNGRSRNNFNNQSAEKLVEKYNTLAKEALSSGDIILSENYLQHADHFMRITEIKNLGQNQNKTSNDNVVTKEASENSLNSDLTKKDSTIEEKK
jgi:hypothetical protein